jgi:hypothetical protein
MNLIPQEYTKHGFTFKLLVRKGKAAIYEQWKAGRLWAYEVVKVRERSAREAMGVTFPASEYLPSDAEWGTSGKSYSVSGTTCVAARKAAEAQMGVWVAPARR